MKRTRLIGPLALVLALVAACSSDSKPTTAASAGSGSQPGASSAPPTSAAPPGKEIHATATSTDQKIGTPVCDAQQHCLIPLTVMATVTGDLTGTSISHGPGALVGTDFAAGDTLIFTGTVTGCGSGTFVIVGTGVGSTTGSSTSNWQIADGLGTGDLVHASGYGTTTVPPGGDPSNPSTLAGRIACDGSTVTAPASPSSTSGKEIHATSKSGAQKIGDPICDVQQHCLIPLTLSGDSYTGDITGSSISESAGALVGTDYAAGGTVIVSGTLADCGRGTLVLMTAGRGSTTGGVSGTWEIAKGLGSGDLVNAAGGGTSVATPNADGSITVTIDGHITCN